MRRSVMLLLMAAAAFLLAGSAAAAKCEDKPFDPKTFNWSSVYTAYPVSRLLTVLLWGKPLSHVWPPWRGTGGVALA